MSAGEMFDNIELQRNLWPDRMPTDPTMVSKLYDGAAQLYSQRALAAGWQATFDRVIPEMDRLLKLGARVVLDAGCADGLLAETYTFPSEVALHGVDIAADCLELARAGGKYASLARASLEEPLPFEPETFDLAVCNGVLGYCASSRPLVELSRVLKPGGHLLLSMRRQDFEDRGYLEACWHPYSGSTLVRTDIFDPFPHNPAYRHDYIFALIKKDSTKQPSGADSF
jgi:SAM-dependent methyltransferase